MGRHPFAIAAWRSGGDQHRKDIGVMAARVEVLKIKPVIPSIRRQLLWPVNDNYFDRLLLS
jgi:hypothetical protein